MTSCDKLCWSGLVVLDPRGWMDGWVWVGRGGWMSE